jgi:peroxiredoxin
MWMTRVLWCAGVYNLVWGALVVCWPDVVSSRLGLEGLSYPEVWQYVGFLTALYGIAYVIAASSPLRHWPIVLIGLLIKVLGPVGFAYTALAGRLPWRFGWTVFANDVVWWVPFGAILAKAYETHVGGNRTTSPEVEEFALRVRTTGGMSLAELSRRQPVLLIFLRHSGCPFCREMLSSLARQKARLEESGTALVFVHMASEGHAVRFLSRYGLDGVMRIRDEKRALYRAFGLGRGRLWQLVGPQLWWRGLRAIATYGQSIAPSGGDLFQMPGVFLLYHGQILRSFRHQTAADRPDFLTLTQPVTE